VYLLPARPLRALLFLSILYSFFFLLPDRPLHTLFHSHDSLGLRPILASTHALNAHTRLGVWVLGVGFRLPVADSWRDSFLSRLQGFGFRLPVADNWRDAFLSALLAAAPALSEPVCYRRVRPPHTGHGAPVQRNIPS
jgi:hypothetical protein